MILHAVGTPATTTNYCLHPSTMQLEIVNDWVAGHPVDIRCCLTPLTPRWVLHGFTGNFRGFPDIYRPWQIGFGRLVSTINWSFSGSMTNYSRTPIKPFFNKYETWLVVSRRRWREDPLWGSGFAGSGFPAINQFFSRSTKITDIPIFIHIHPYSPSVDWYWLYQIPMFIIFIIFDC